MATAITIRVAHPSNKRKVEMFKVKYGITNKWIWKTREEKDALVLKHKDDPGFVIKEVL